METDPMMGATASLVEGRPTATRLWRLDDGVQSLVLAMINRRLSHVIYWGPALPASEDLAQLFAGHLSDITGGMLDAVPDLSVCPEPGNGFPGHPGVICRHHDGAPLHPNFLFHDATQNDTGLELTYRDQGARLSLRITYDLCRDTGVIVARTHLSSEALIWVDWLSAPVMPGPQDAHHLMDFGGRWCGEFQCQNTPWTAGIRLRDNRTGRSDHAHFPGLIVPARGTTNTQGAAWAWHYGWSGGHRMVAEELPDGRRQIQFGHVPQAHRAPASSFETAPLFLSYSQAGLNGCAVAFQRHVRDQIVTWPRSATARPVHYNCWEAVYFDHDLSVLKEIATQAADIGAERFVLDDGWFGQRDDDTSSLGDWTVDGRKYPDGLGPLIAHVHALGMGFGLWFEPEMVNENSALHRAHPDWIFGPPDQIRGRQQLVLDLSQSAVQSYLYEAIAALLSSHPIDYIKWDHNRVLPHLDAAQTAGTYALMDRLRADFPSVEIESCASGGGRIDYGILERTQRVWLSDSNDALERLRIQHDAALFLPAMVTGSHVGPRTCHTSGRMLDIHVRAWVAAQRHMGFEMDPRELDARERAVLKEVTAWWKANRAWLAQADLLRLDAPDPAIIAEQHLALDGARFVVFAGKAATSAQIAPRPLCFTGLEPTARYRVTLINRDTAPALSRGHPILKDAALTVSGTWLMAQGVSLPWSFPETMWVLEGERL